MFEQTIKLNIAFWERRAPIQVYKSIEAGSPENEIFQINIKALVTGSFWYIRTKIFFKRNTFGVTFDNSFDTTISFELSKEIEPLKLNIQDYYIENNHLIIKVIETENELPIQLESNERKLLK